MDDDDLETTCGLDIDHEEDVVYEDDEVTQIWCRKCGAEWWEDK